MKMRRVLRVSLMEAIVVLGAVCLTACQSDDNDGQKRRVVINYRCASLAEGKQLLLSNSEYYSQLTQNDIEWRVRKTGATLSELKTMAGNSVRDFTEEEKTYIARGVDFVRQRLEAMGARALPFPSKDIVFVRTTLKEEGSAAAYTHKTHIYMGDGLMDKAKTEPNVFYECVAHELFHCLTRNSPDFRSRMYRLIGFTMAGKDYEFSPDIRKMILANPDVEHMDNCATFTIDGVKRKCELIVLYTKTWAEAYAEVGEKASMFNYNKSVLVPVDALNTYYDIDKVPDFWDMMGRNTDYVFAPEECLADNFAYAVVYGISGRQYKTPKLIEDIIMLLRE